MSSPTAVLLPFHGINATGSLWCLPQYYWANSPINATGRVSCDAFPNSPNSINATGRVRSATAADLSGHVSRPQPKLSFAHIGRCKLLHPIQPMLMFATHAHNSCLLFQIVFLPVSTHVLIRTHQALQTYCKLYFSSLCLCSLIEEVQVPKYFWQSLNPLVYPIPSQT